MVEHSRYAFLEMLHATLKPRGYLEIGVQAGGSLSLAQCPSIGIDPEPLVDSTDLHHIFKGTSEQFFNPDGNAKGWHFGFPLDLVFIDGMHLFEYALADFINVEQYAHQGTVVVFDDVLPYSSAIAAREQPPGDWTGDVWKVEEVLWQFRPDLKRVLVDTFPTGALVVWNLDPGNQEMVGAFVEILGTPEWGPGVPVPDSVLTRSRAVSPGAALTMIMEGRT